MYRLFVSVSPQKAEELSDLYLEMGASSVSVSYEEGGAVLSVLSDSELWFKEVGFSDLPHMLSESSWQYQHEQAMDFYKLIPGVWIQSIYSTKLLKRKGLFIRLDPRGAFGDGAHPTTQLCAEFLKKYTTSKTKSFLDIGTGSGILSIYASFLAIDEILGVDNDLVSVERSKQNMALNDADIKIIQGDVLQDMPDVPKQHWDVVCANLQSEILLQSLSRIKTHIKPDGVLILSGIAKQWKKTVLRKVLDEGLVVKESRVKKGWCGIVCGW